ncbi:MAG TPA: hypothetical protein VJJ23_03300 [Candidatus Nanoarchaeia archaeon]|nr:hypothetical protein [Candidatus Nanoarchaeia archaeon]
MSDNGDNKDTILLDTSFLAEPINEGYISVRDGVPFTSTTDFVLDYERKESFYNGIIENLKNPDQRVFTSIGCLKEFSNFVEHYLARIVNLKYLGSPGAKYPRTYSKEHMKYFDCLLNRVKNVRSLLRNNLYKAEFPDKLEVIENLFVEIGIRYRVKKPNESLINDGKRRHRFNDERLCALAFYELIVNDNSTYIATKDNDIIILLNVFNRLIEPIAKDLDKHIGTCYYFDGEFKKNVSRAGFMVRFEDRDYVFKILEEKVL